MLSWQDRELSARIAVLSKQHAQLARQYRQNKPIPAIKMDSDVPSLDRSQAFRMTSSMIRVWDECVALFPSGSSPHPLLLKPRSRNLSSRDGRYSSEITLEFNYGTVNQLLDWAGIAIIDTVDSTESREFNCAFIYNAAYEYFDRKCTAEVQGISYVDRYNIVAFPDQLDSSQHYAIHRNRVYREDVKEFLEQCAEWPNLETRWHPKERLLHLSFTLMRSSASVN